MLFSLVGLAFATHVTTFDVNVRWTKAPFSGLESLVVDPVAVLGQLRPLELPADVEEVANLAPKGERALVFTNPIASWADVSLNGLPIGTIGPYATMRLEGVTFGTYTVGLKSPTAYVRTFGVRVAPAPRIAPPVAVVVKRDRIDLSDNIFFELDSAVIRAESFSLLDAVAAALTAHPEVLLARIEGHTDSRGEAAYNQTLSEARSTSVLDYLVRAGVAPDRLLASGFGESMPVDPAETEEAWERNRRVEFLVVKHAEPLPAEALPGEAPPGVQAPKKKGK